MKKRFWRTWILVFITVLFVLGKGSALRAFAFDEIGIRYDCGDRTFFHSDYISDINDSYKNFSLVNNGEQYQKNSVILNRCGENRYNPNRTDNTIYLMKNSRYDCYFDVTGLHTKAFSYYLVRGKVKTDRLGAELKLCSYKAYVDNAYSNFHTLSITPEGYFTAADGTKLRQAKAGEWVSYAVAFNFLSHKADIYLDGKKVHTLSFNEKIKKPEVFRFWIFHDNKEKDPLDGVKNGDMTLDELEVTGMEKPYTGDETNYTSVLYDDAPIKSYLADKTVYYPDGGSVFYGGEKSRPEMILYYDKEIDELYGDVRALNAGFGFSAVQEDGTVKEARITVKESGVAIYGGRIVRLLHPILSENGVMLLPIKEVAERVMEKESFQDGWGIFIFSDTKIQLNLEDEVPEYAVQLRIPYPETDIKSIRRYMAFTRPKAETMRQDFEKTNSGHPRLMADKTTFDFIRSEANRNGSYIKKVCDTVLVKAGAVRGKEPLTYNIPDKQRILDISREMVSRMEVLSFAYQVTGDQSYADAAWKNLEAVLSYPDWNPSHMIDVGEMNFAVALAYDWCYDGFTLAQRERIWEGIRHYGMEVTRLCYYGRVPYWSQWANYTDAFVRWKSNFNAVINGGALAAAMAFAECDPAFCFDIAEKAVRSLEYTMIGFEPDGTWIEGTGYWEYTMSYLSKGIGSMMTALGTEYGLMHYSGTEKNALWYRSMYSPQGGNNFHDSGVGNASYAHFSWLAQVYGDPRYAKTRRAAIKNGHAYCIYDAIWYQPGISSTESGYSMYTSFKGIESVTARGSYTEDNTMYFSAHAGQVFCYHSQADVGSFVFDAQGVRWACDLGAEDYNVQRDGGLKYYGSYRRRAEAHNVVVINPNTDDADGGQKNDAFVPFVRTDETDYGSFTEYDMTPAYADYTDFYRRQFHTVTDADTLIVTDVISLKEKSDVCWFMTTQADVSWTDATHFVLSSGGKTMYGSVDINCSDFTSETTACEPLLGAPVLEGQNTNAGYSRVVIRANAEGLLKIRVTLSPDKNYNPYTISDVKDYIIRDFSVYDGETVLDRTFSEGVCKSAVSGYFYGEEGCCLIMAQYDHEGVLRDTAVSGIGSLSGHLTAVTAELPAQALENSMLKVFLWDKNSFVPLELPKKLQYQPK